MSITTSKAHKSMYVSKGNKTGQYSSLSAPVKKKKKKKSIYSGQS